MPLFVLILSGCASRQDQLQQALQSDYQQVNAVYLQERAALLKIQKAEYEDALRWAKGKTPEQIRAFGTALRERHIAQQRNLLDQATAVLQERQTTLRQAAAQPSYGNALLGAGMALSGAAAWSQYAQPSYSSGDAVIIQPGQMPTYFYNNGDHGTIIQPGQMPTYIYPQ